MAELEKRVERDRQIIAMRAQGLSWPTIAAAVDLSDRRCREIWSEYRQQGKFEIQELDPLDIVWDALTRMEAQQEELGEIASAARGAGEYQAAAAAIRSQAGIQRNQLELYLATGIVPRNLGHLQVEIDVHHVATRLMELFEKYGLPLEAKAELLDLLRQGGADSAAQRLLPERAGD